MSQLNRDVEFAKEHGAGFFRAVRRSFEEKRVRNSILLVAAFLAVLETAYQVETITAAGE